MTSIRYAAIGDSFTEGVGDELPGGQVRGWADLVAQQWANSRGEPVSYLNFAVRGKLAWEVVTEQLEQALALKPTHLSFNGGGNDMLRPYTSIARVVDAFMHVLRRCTEDGVSMILISGANPSPLLPLGRTIQRRGDALSAAVSSQFEGCEDVVQALNWDDHELSLPEYWSNDRLHLNARGHHRVAARVLHALGEDSPAPWWSLPESGDTVRCRGVSYYRDYVVPWTWRRLTGRSSGDNHPPKHQDWIQYRPAPEQAYGPHNGQGARS